MRRRILAYVLYCSESNSTTTYVTEFEQVLFSVNSVAGDYLFRTISDIR